MARERRGAGFSVVSIDIIVEKSYIEDKLYADEQSDIKIIFYNYKTIIYIVFFV